MALQKPFPAPAAGPALGAEKGRSCKGFVDKTAINRYAYKRRIGSTQAPDRGTDCLNIYDISKEAGVSIATVSRVLNDKGMVSPATRAKVQQVLAANHYTPSAIARGMVSKSLRTVAVLTVDIRVPHYARTAYTIEREFSRRGYEVILCNTGGDKQASLEYLRAVVKKQVDGIVLVGSVFNAICRSSEMTGLLRKAPVVLANGVLPLANASSVLVDDRRGIALAVEHLVGTGRRALFYVKDKSTASADEKRDGFVQAMAQAGLDSTGRILETGETLEDGMAAARRILESGLPCDGVVCGEDLTAVGVLKGLRRAGVAVPQTIAVTGYNNSEYARLCEPVLTTVDNKGDEVAMLCVQLLESRIETPADGTSVTIQPVLVEGETG